ncbi:hypothetical protein PMAYCL1PPCAC_13434, partial [Pristionchus mayeri]
EAEILARTPTLHHRTRMLHEPALPVVRPASWTHRREKGPRNRAQRRCDSKLEPAETRRTY